MIPAPSISFNSKSVSGYDLLAKQFCADESINDHLDSLNIKKSDMEEEYTSAK